MSIADWSKPLGGFRVSRMSRAGGRDVAVAMRDCGISTMSHTRPVCKHRFSVLPIDKTSSVEAQSGLLWLGLCSSSYRVWDWSERPFGAGFRSRGVARCCENPARASARAGFSRHLSAGFTDLNPAPRGLSLYNHVIIIDDVIIKKPWRHDIWIFSTKITICEKNRPVDSLRKG